MLDARIDRTRVPAGELRRRAPVDVATAHARRSNAEPLPLWLRAPSAINLSLAINILLLKTEIKHRVPGSPTRNYAFKLEITFCVRGVISPALANCALDGLERLLKEEYPTGKALKSFGGLCPSVNFIRYADDFVITGRSKELLEGEVKPLVEQFLQQRGLELSPKKTVITHVEKGFDFLGQNVRRYPNGKLLIKPSKKNVKTFLDGIRRIIKASIGRSAADLIGKLNPKIRGWANYHRHVVSKHTFVHVDSIIFGRIWQWARRRHPKKSSEWLKKRYFGQRRGRDWTFFSETCDDEGQPGKLWLHRASSTPIKRHIKVKGEANPYDPACETYFEKREADHMQDTFRGTRTSLSLA